ncbi:hypothetical protein P4S72_28635 [Vibrio sp. PP-XX7]
MTAGGHLTLNAAGVTNHGEISATGETHLALTGGLSNTATGVISGKNTVLKAQTVTNQGQLQALDDLGLTATALENAGALVALHDLTLNAGTQLTSTGNSPPGAG